MSYERIWILVSCFAFSLGVTGAGVRGVRAQATRSPTYGHDIQDPYQLGAPPSPAAEAENLQGAPPDQPVVPADEARAQESDLTDPVAVVEILDEFRAHDEAMEIPTVAEGNLTVYETWSVRAFKRLLYDAVETYGRTDFLRAEFFRPGTFERWLGRLGASWNPDELAELLLEFGQNVRTVRLGLFDFDNWGRGLRTPTSYRSVGQATVRLVQALHGDRQSLTTLRRIVSTLPTRTTKRWATETNSHVPDPTTCRPVGHGPHIDDGVVASVLLPASTEVVNFVGTGMSAEALARDLAGCVEHDRGTASAFDADVCPRGESSCLSVRLRFLVEGSRTWTNVTYSLRDAEDYESAVFLTTTASRTSPSEPTAVCHRLTPWDTEACEAAGESHSLGRGISLPIEPSGEACGALTSAWTTLRAPVQRFVCWGSSE